MARFSSLGCLKGLSSSPRIGNVDRPAVGGCWGNGPKIKAEGELAVGYRPQESISNISER